jgi:hypothetical protein
METATYRPVIVREQTVHKVRQMFSSGLDTYEIGLRLHLDEYVVCRLLHSPKRQRGR